MLILVQEMIYSIISSEIFITNIFDFEWQSYDYV